MSNNLTIKDIVECTGGELISGNESMVCETYERDTRKIKNGDTFVAIVGENFDGNLLWKNAIESGAKALILNYIDFTDEDREKYKNIAIIKVKDSLEALQKMATKKREMYGKNLTLVAITGSVGKTSTKDAIAGVLSEKYKVKKTEGNMNNDLGVPLTILEIQDEEVAVVEMGMNHFGEISRLSKIAKPDISVITNIGTSHIGNLGSRENILKAKLEILDGMEEPKLVLNNDNDLLHNWYEENKEKIEISTFGIENKSDISASNIELHENYSKCFFYDGEQKYDVMVPVPGKHYVLNSLCAALIGKLLGLSNEQIKNGIGKYELTKKRMEFIELKDNITIINDSYNASYESMKAAIEYLGNIEKGRKIAVLGDMFELGDFSEELHRKVGKEVALSKIDILLCSGENSKYIAEEAIKEGMRENQVIYTNTKEELYEKIKNIIKADDNILIKASNGMKFYELAELLKNKE